MLIPILRDDKETDSWQGGIQQIVSLQQLKDTLTKGNLAYWCYTMLLRINNEGPPDVKLNCVTEEQYSLWKQDNFTIPNGVEIHQLADAIWAVLNKVL